MKQLCFFPNPIATGCCMAWLIMGGEDATHSSRLCFFYLRKEPVQSMHHFNIWLITIFPVAWKRFPYLNIE
jgi:hypothetical protein